MWNTEMMKVSDFFIFLIVASCNCLSKYEYDDIYTKEDILNNGDWNRCYGAPDEKRATTVLVEPSGHVTYILQQSTTMSPITDELFDNTTWFEEFLAQNQTSGTPGTGVPSWLEKLSNDSVSIEELPGMDNLTGGEFTIPQWLEDFLIAEEKLKESTPAPVPSVTEIPVSVPADVPGVPADVPGVPAEVPGVSTLTDMIADLFRKQITTLVETFVPGEVLTEILKEKENETTTKSPSGTDSSNRVTYILYRETTTLPPFIHELLEDKETVKPTRGNILGSESLDEEGTKLSCEQLKPLYLGILIKDSATLPDHRMKYNSSGFVGSFLLEGGTMQLKKGIVMHECFGQKVEAKRWLLSYKFWVPNLTILYRFKLNSSKEGKESENIVGNLTINLLNQEMETKLGSSKGVDGVCRYYYDGEYIIYKLFKENYKLNLSYKKYLQGPNLPSNWTKVINSFFVNHMKSLLGLTAPEDLIEYHKPTTEELGNSFRSEMKELCDL